VLTLLIFSAFLFCALFLAWHRLIDGAKKKTDRPAEDGRPLVVTDECHIEPDSDAKVKYGCGHTSWRDFHGVFYGESYGPASKKRGRDTCPECVLAKTLSLSIRCALCGLVIMPGAPVALYAGPTSSFRKSCATKHEGQFVGCLRWDCCPSGGFFAGHWDGEKVLPAFDGGNCAAAEALRTGRVVISNTEPPGSTPDGKNPKNR